MISNIITRFSINIILSNFFIRIRITCIVGNGEVKGAGIRLKYKADHAFAGLENGNRLIKMVLEKRSIPYSLRIGGEWCRVIHNDQQPVCSECKEL